jgi:dUTP pyrophosphatase
VEPIIKKIYNIKIPCFNILKMKVKRLRENVHLPTRGSSGAVGYDLYSDEDVNIPRGARALVGTGVAIVLPVGTYGRVAPRSGLAVKRGIQVGAGVIDPDYTGEVKVLLFNHGDAVFEVKKGERVAQLVLERCETPEIEEVGVIQDTERGAGGFGSTGTTCLPPLA